MPDHCQHDDRWVEIFAATSSGCLDLEATISLPLVCIQVSCDPGAAIADMSRQHFAAGALWYDSFQPFEWQRGWTDWRIIPLGPVNMSLPAGIVLREGHLEISLPLRVNPLRFAAKLFQGLERLEFQNVVTSPAWLLAQSDKAGRVCMPPRYTMDDPNDFRAGATRVENLFVIDPSEHCLVVAHAALVARKVIIQETEEMAARAS